MTFHEKLARRVAELGLNKARAARDVGLPESTISSYISNAKSLPRIDIAAKIAKAIRVPLDWLVDDDADYPPPEVSEAGTVTDLTDRQLLHELAKRHRRAMLDFHEAVRRAKTIDWMKAADEAARTPAGQPLPALAQQAQAAIESVQTKFGHAMQDFDTAFYALVHHDELPGGDRPLEDFDPAIQGFMWTEVEDLQHLNRFVEAIKGRPWMSSELNQVNELQQAAGRRHSDAVAIESPTLRKLFKRAGI